MKLTIYIALSLGIAISGCATETLAIVDDSSSALTCEPFDDSYCDPAFYCDLGSSSYNSPPVECNDGIRMQTWVTPDCRWCINRDVCIGHGGPWVCPF